MLNDMNVNPNTRNWASLVKMIFPILDSTMHGCLRVLVILIHFLVS